MVNVSKKCIIFCRVSTDRQNFDEQENRLVRLASERGYPPDSQIIIGYKESGIRLSEEERLGLNDLKDYINSDSSIDCVFAFEISRIARSKKVLFSIEDFLVSRKIQLIIEEPSITLLNSDGSVNNSAELLFTMFSQLAESEMRVKQERFRNGRARAKKEGHWHGGKVLYGFRVEDKRYVPDEETAPIVLRLFQMYADGASQLACAQYLAEFGIIRKGHNMSKMFGNPKYIDIVGKELFNKVNSVKHDRPRPNKKFRLYSPGEGVLKCACCGRHYVHITNCYVCLGRTKPYKDCAEGFSIVDSYVDSLLIMFAKYSYTARLAVTRQDDEKRIRKILDEIPVKLNALNQRRHKQEVKRSRIIDLYAEEKLSRSDMERRLKSADKEIRKIDEEQNALIVEQTSLQVSLRDYQEGKIASSVDSTLATFEKATKREISELIKSEIEEVEVYRLGKYKYFKFNMKAGYSNLARMSGRARCFKCEIEVNGSWVDHKLDK